MAAGGGHYALGVDAVDVLVVLVVGPAAAAVFERLLQHAAEMKSENDLTV